MNLFKLALINALPLLVALVIGVDLIRALGSATAYPFGSDFFPATSIYRSKAIYCGYNLLTLVMLLLLVPLSYHKRWKWYYAVLAIAVVLVTLPMLTTE